MTPLDGVRVLELVGLGPAPFATLLLADLGAEVVRVDRTGDRTPAGADPVNRGRPAVRVDLKTAGGREVVLRLAESCDVFIEPFRPGVAERLGLGPDVCLARNPGLVYVRMTGWGQTGPLASTAGHDINYLAMSGVLHQLRRSGAPPMPPLNLLGDYAGGSMFMVTGILAALLATRATGRGQVIDVSILDGTAALTAPVVAWRRIGAWESQAGTNLLQTAAPFYDTYLTADEQYIAVGAIEPQFYRQFLKGIGLNPDQLPSQYDRSQWPATKTLIAERIAAHPRAHWEAVFAGTDACVSPVLSPDEAAQHPHNRERGVYLGDDATAWPAPAPRFSGTPAARATAPPCGIELVLGALRKAGYDDGEIEELIAHQVIAAP